MFGKQQFVGKVDGVITDKYDILKVIDNDKLIKWKKFLLLLKRIKSFLSSIFWSFKASAWELKKA